MCKVFCMYSQCAGNCSVSRRPDWEYLPRQFRAAAEACWGDVSTRALYAGRAGR